MDIPTMRNFDGAQTVAVVSGGLDSVTMLYWLDYIGDWEKILVLSFNYGQRHVKELEFAKWHAEQLGAGHAVVDLRNLNAFISNSALTSKPSGDYVTLQGDRVHHEGIEVPEGHYAAETMKATVVPNRNMMMMSIAGAVAVNERAAAMGVGMHAGDHEIYPDCRPEFVIHFETTIKIANEGFIHPQFQVLAPFLSSAKTDIVRIGHQLGVDFAYTWSCYKGGEMHCGRCSTCVERREAFHLAEVEDPTEYLDKYDFWKQAVGLVK